MFAATLQPPWLSYVIAAIVFNSYTLGKYSWTKTYKKENDPQVMNSKSYYCLFWHRIL